MLYILYEYDVNVGGGGRGHDFFHISLSAYIYNNDGKCIQGFL